MSPVDKKIELVNRLVNERKVTPQLLDDFKKLKTEPLWHMTLLLVQENEHFKSLLNSCDQSDIDLCSNEIIDSVVKESQKTYLINSAKSLIGAISAKITKDRVAKDQDKNLKKMHLLRRRIKANKRQKYIREKYLNLMGTYTSDREKLMDSQRLYRRTLRDKEGYNIITKTLLVAFFVQLLIVVAHHFVEQHDFNRDRNLSKSSRVINVVSLSFFRSCSA